MRLNPQEFHGVHGKDERIQLAALAESVGALHTLFQELAKAEPEH